VTTAPAFATRLLLTLLLACAQAGAEDLLSLPTRPGITQSLLLAAPTEPRAIAVLFPGGDGVADLTSLQDRFDLARGNFLIRARKHLIENQVATAVLTAPSDQASGMGDDFRMGDAHVADVRAVIAELKRRHPGIPVYLIGTSRGTVSAAYAGRALAPEIAGIVLTATVTLPNKRRPPEMGLSGFDYASLRARVLLVHHQDDGCYVSPYRGVRGLAERFPLITVSAGLPARSDPCQALSPHGFIGQEAKTMEAIAAWMQGKPARERIE